MNSISNRAISTMSSFLLPRAACKISKVRHLFSRPILLLIGIRFHLESYSIVLRSGLQVKPTKAM